ncbi:coiled-coil domain-containing protein 181 isoform X2 [Callorhinchus milii]|uniref:coiled-coil domain-containing protein 181 isoform X2 n=1 Tax=Callorhinchus milii TaxID=7868 RepID=UPI001C3FA461|nr:coiled-coil domain-containing protein 181 isoform X2 [Callorhinchus milii]
MSEENSDSSQAEEYEDDFEKDLDWLINEEASNGNLEADEEDENFETKIDKELEDDETKEKDNSKAKKQCGNSSKSPCVLNEDLNKVVKPTKAETDGDDNQSNVEKSSDSLIEEFKQECQREDEELNEEIKRYIMEKIEQANKQLQNEDPVDQNRERRLKFKEKLVDLEVPPLEFSETEKDNEDVTGRMSEMCISNNVQEDISFNNKNENSPKDKRVLIEKDGKFELVSLWDLESQGLLPQIAVAFSELDCKQDSPRSSSSGFSSINSKGNDLSGTNGEGLSSPLVEFLHSPKPPPKDRSTSATDIQKIQNTLPRRVQSANFVSRRYPLLITPQQKGLNWKSQQKKEQFKNEKQEIRRTEEEERKREENKMAFNAWLLKKRQQKLEERRIQCAKEMERKNMKACSGKKDSYFIGSSPDDHQDPNEAFALWLKRKREQQIREKQMEAMRKQEQEYNLKAHAKEDSEKAFKQWLKRKKIQKRAEQLAAKERSRRYVMEAREARRMQDILYSINGDRST